MLKRIAGMFMLILGVMLVCWIMYNLLVERLPETQGRSPLPAIVLSAALFYVGFNWVRGKVRSGGGRFSSGANGPAER